ncbi:MAG: protein translocase subunit SecF, partial [Candidatus Eiseniibacteriota bacterium]
MQILVDTKIDFMGKRRIAFFLSVAALLVSIGSLIMHGGPRLSIDFTGGTFVQAAFEPMISAEELRGAVRDAGLESVEIQRLTGSNEFIIRMKNEEVAAASTALLGDEEAPDPFAVIKHAVDTARPDIETTLMRQETVGPKIGEELRGRAVQSILVALVLMLVYIAIRFSGLFFALGAVVALFHDVIIVLGVFSITGREVSLTILAALLTIAGYSINDTIVVFDRIREQLKLMRRDSLETVINKSINLTLSRTVLTSLTTLFAVVSLFIFGG